MSGGGEEKADTGKTTAGIRQTHLAMLHQGSQEGFEVGQCIIMHPFSSLSLFLIYFLFLICDKAEELCCSCRKKNPALPKYSIGHSTSCISVFSSSISIPLRHRNWSMQRTRRNIVELAGNIPGAPEPAGALPSIQRREDLIFPTSSHAFACLETRNKATKGRAQQAECLPGIYSKDLILQATRQRMKTSRDPGFSI